MRFIQILGTNGKGTTSTYIANILTEAGYRTGLYTSPHLISREERIRIDGKKIPKEVFDELEKKYLDEGSFFKVFTKVCIDWFTSESVDFAVLECGLGGRRDPTTFYPSEVKVFTRIGMDHMHILGNSIESIAEEKFAAVRPHIKVVTIPQRKAAMDVAMRVAAENDAELIVTDGYSLMPDGTVSYKGINGLQINSPADAAKINACLAIEAVKAIDGIDIVDDVIREAVRKTVMPGRVQYFRDERILIDGAHNSDALEELHMILRKHHKGNMVLLTAATVRKDVSELSRLADEFGSYVVTTCAVPSRNLRAVELARQFKSAVAIEDVHEAYLYARKKAHDYDALLLVAGSLYLAGSVLDELGYEC